MNLKSKQAKAHLALFVANLMFGINYSVAKGVMPNYLSPLGFTLLRVIASSFLFWAIASFGKNTEKIEKKDYLRFIAAGLFGITFNQLLFLNGLNFSTPIESSIISTLNPAMVILIAYFLLSEPITTKKIIGLIIGASGALLLILGNGSVSISDKHLLGNTMLFLNTLSYAFYLVVVKPLTLKYRPVTVMKGVFTVGLLSITPFGFTDLLNTSWNAIPIEIFASIAFVLLGPTFLAYLLNGWGLQHVHTSTVSIYIYSQPVIAAFIAVMFGVDTLDLRKIIAAILVFTGVFLVSQRKRKKVAT
ncbi:MAG: hypothetical protein PWR03_424 [Tenuifilum sp.]|jgi:drug/metabolite transporter (DMT)-like permease|uniref:DMT family transporter n=1 Tax=Tenuifilum sp. TaxID=2760880 RepID=UPI0024AAC8C3|nr:DMT family transporter [Tenuifilum sp.]MDI3526241.1 hypothetical protein [Tenuifilum sp.]